jgi:phage terminase small subunit
MALTPKQERFVGEYLKDLNATQAAIRAGYSPSSAAEIGYENLRKPQIASTISEAFKARAERTRVEADRVVLELAQIGFSDIREIASWGEGGFAYKASDELTDEAAATIAGIVETVTRTCDGRKRRTLAIKLHDKLRSLELLGRHLGIFTDRINMSSPPADGFVIRLEGLPDKPRKPISEGG